MRLTNKYVLPIVGACAMILTLYFVHSETGLSGELEWLLTLAGTAVLALAFGRYQYVADCQSDDDRRPFFDSGLWYTAFWALFWSLFVHTLGVMTAAGRTGAGSVGSLVPWWLVAGAFVVTLLIGVALGGVAQQFRPSHWLEEYRRGRS